MKYEDVLAREVSNSESRIYGSAYPWLQVSVRKLILMHEVQTFQQLPKYHTCFGLFDGRLQILLQIAKRKVLHGNEDRAI